MTEIECPHCGARALKPLGAVNRSRKKGAPVYCGKVCAGLAQRSGKSIEQKRAEKAEYDRTYLAENAETLKRKKADYFRRTYDPVSAAAHRKTRMGAHKEYCRRPEYRAWKKEYDRTYRAKKTYGEWAECFLLAQDIRGACLEVSSDYQIRQDAGTLNKSAKRKRDYERLNSNQSEKCPLGHA